MEELVSAIIFFSLVSGAGYSFTAVHAYFYSHSCCMTFFIVTALQEIIFSIFHSFLKDQMVNP